MVNTIELKALAAENAAAEHYMDGKRLLADAETNNDPLLARRAHSAFIRTLTYYRNYKEADRLRDISKELGTTHVLINIEDHMLQTLSSNYIGEIRNKPWVNYYLDPNARSTYDLTSTLSIIDANISPEREVVDRHTETKTTERWVDKVNRRGELVRDTLGNIIQERIEETLIARVRLIQRSKSAAIIAVAAINDYDTGRALTQEPIEITIDFVSEQVRVQGDRRALSSRFRDRNEGVIESFPSDHDMIIDGHQKILYAYQEIVHEHTY